jgi:uncharacterized protein (DUF305 family)
MQSLQRAYGLSVTVLIMLAIALGARALPSQTLSAESEFLARNDVAMERMMQGMKIQGSGDIDRDFANLMIPHHQGAIDMAAAELIYGRNAKLRRIAEEIIVDQQQEIAAMRLAIDESPLKTAIPKDHLHVP